MFSTRVRTRVRHCPSRSGIAPLELVLSLPAIFLVVVSTAALGWAVLQKSGAAIEVRKTTWKERLNLNSVATGREFERHPLSALGAASPESGEVFRKASIRVNLPSWMGNTDVAVSGNAVLIGTWDYREVTEFEGSSFHYGVLAKMAQESALNLGNLNLSILENFGSLISPALGDQFLGDAADAAGKIADAKNAARDVLEDAREQLERLRDALEAANDALQVAEDLADTFIIIPDWLTDRIDDLQDVVQGLQDQITELEDQIDQASSLLDSLP